MGLSLSQCPLKTKEYNTVVKAHSGNLYRFVLKCIRNPDDASDIVQDSYLKLWQNKDKVIFEKAKSWLFTTSYRALLNKVKKDARMEPIDTKDYAESHAQDKSADLKEILDKTLDTLPHLQKSIILLRDLEGYNYQEIGEMLELTESQVKVYLFRGRQKIKTRLIGLNLFA